MTDPLDTAAGQTEADKNGWLSPSALVDAALDLHDDAWVARIEAEATARRYGGQCARCGVFRDYHPDYQSRTKPGTATHEFQPR